MVEEIRWAIVIIQASIGTLGFTFLVNFIVAPSRLEQKLKDEVITLRNDLDQHKLSQPKIDIVVSPQPRKDAILQVNNNGGSGYFFATGRIMEWNDPGPFTLMWEEVNSDRIYIPHGEGRRLKIASHEMIRGNLTPTSNYEIHRFVIWKYTAHGIERIEKGQHTLQSNSKPPKLTLIIKITSEPSMETNVYRIIRLNHKLPMGRIIMEDTDM